MEKEPVEFSLHFFKLLKIENTSEHGLALAWEKYKGMWNWKYWQELTYLG